MRARACMRVGGWVGAVYERREGGGACILSSVAAFRQVCVCVYNVSALSIGKDSGSIFSALSYREKFVKE